MFSDLCLQTNDELIKAAGGKKIVLWGRCEEFVSQVVEKYNNVSYIVDSDCEKWGNEYKGFMIYSPMKLYSEEPKDTIILVTAGPNYAYEVTEQIRRIDNFKIFYSHVIMNPWFNAFSVSLYNNLSRVKECVKLMTDEKSKKIYSEVIKRRIIGCSNEYSELKIQGEKQYLADIIYKNIKNEIIIDCGAYIGDTSKRFVSEFRNKVKRIYAYEALPQNLEKLYVQQDNLKKEYGWNGELIVLPFAVADKTSVLQFWETELANASFIPDLRSTADLQVGKRVKSLKVEARSIDETIPENEEVTLIKMDIEGAEYSALIGAEKTIKRTKPRCAISIYHNPLDYINILELLKDYVPQYKFAVRHYKARHVDTVLYAWVEE